MCDGTIVRPQRPRAMGLSGPSEAARRTCSLLKSSTSFFDLSSIALPALADSENLEIMFSSVGSSLIPGGAEEAGRRSGAATRLPIAPTADSALRRRAIDMAA